MTQKSARHLERVGPISPHSRNLPLRVGTRGSPLARRQTALFLDELRRVCPVLGVAPESFAEEIITTTGDQVQDRRLADIGGKGLFAKEIHEALLDYRIDLAVHSLKDLETVLPDGVVLACTMKREDARDALVLRGQKRLVSVFSDIWSLLPGGAKVGTASLRRQAQLLHVRPDLSISLLRGNVRTRIDRVRSGAVDGTLLAYAGLRRLGFAEEVSGVIDPDVMVPAAGQGIIGITVRAADVALASLLVAVECSEAKAVSTAERALLAALDGSCRTPIGGHARIFPDGSLQLTGLVARADGSFLLKRSISGIKTDADRLGKELGNSLRRDSPSDIFAC